MKFFETIAFAENDYDPLVPFENKKHTEYADLNRRDVRSLIFYLLYMFEATEETFDHIVAVFSNNFKIEVPQHSEVVVTAKSIIAAQEMLDNAYKKHLQNWELDRISLCTKLVLRFGVWELICTKTDPRIVINEAIELAKVFCDDDAYRFINGILDAIAKG